MSRKHSHQRKSILKKTRLREMNLFLKKEKELYQEVPQRMLGISDQQLGRLFENAWALVSIHEGVEAVRAFRLLCQLHPYVSDFWYGLAHALRESGNHEEALDAFLMAETMEPNRFEYYQEAIRSALDVGKQREAKRIFNRLLAHKESIEDFRSHKMEMQQLAEAISQGSSH